MQTLLLIDLSHIFWTHWHATANEEVGAAYHRTVDAVRQLSSRVDADFVAVCLDAPPYKRKLSHPTYKAQRDAPEPAAVDQFRRAQERLVADGYLLWSAKGYEADDVIATATAWATSQGIGVTIATNDKDLLQLVSDEHRVDVLSTKTGDLMTETQVFAKYGIPPHKVRDFLALIGDTADNVPGVPGVGTKRAAELLKTFGNLEAIQKVAQDGDPDTQLKPPSVRETLLKNQEQLKIAKELVSLMTDAPIDPNDLTKPRQQQQLVEVQDAEFEDEEEPVEAKQETVPVPAETKPVESKPEPKETNGNGTNALAIVSPQWTMALEPRSVGQAWTVAKALFNSRLFGVSSAEAAFAIIMAGRAMGLDSATSLRGFHIIEGKPVMSAALIQGLILGSGKAKYFQLIESTATVATYETWRIGNPRPTKMSYTIEEAKAAGLVDKRNSQFVLRPKTQLRWRCVAELGRAEYPDVITGVYVPGELDEEPSTPAAAE